MKDRPIHFSANKISEASIIEFIMENTTFDWNDEWAELWYCLKLKLTLLFLYEIKFILNYFCS